MDWSDEADCHFFCVIATQGLLLLLLFYLCSSSDLTDLGTFKWKKSNDFIKKKPGMTIDIAEEFSFISVFST